MSRNNGEVNDLRILTRGTYDIQQLRISTGNRIVGNFRAKLGFAASVPEKQASKEAQEVMTIIRESYTKIITGVLNQKPIKLKNFKGNEVISSFTEFALVTLFMDLEKGENEHFKRIKDLVSAFPIWTEFLVNVKGCGETMAAVLISEIDIHEASHVTKIYKYAGLDVAQDGKGRSRRKEHLVEYEYKDKKGEDKVRMGITFNPFLKTKLMGVLGPLFLKHRSSYTDFYYNYKNRQEQDAKWGVHNDGKKDVPAGERTSKLRRHNQAMRYMVKMFIKDLYVAWRTIEGLLVSDPYEEVYLGRRHNHVVNQ